MASRTGGKENPIVRGKYVEWYKIPRAERLKLGKEYERRGEKFPTCKADFAEMHNVNRATLWRWEQDPDFKRDVANDALGLVSADELSIMIDVIKQKAMDGDLKAFESIMKFVKIAEIGSAMPKDDEQDAWSSYSDEELESMFGGEWEDE